MSLTITSPAFADGDPIPVVHTCDGDDRSPPLAFAGLPQGTRSLALVVDDPDAPDPAAPQMTFVHWVLYNLPPETAGLPAGIRNPAELPEGTQEGRNNWDRPGYGGPCPPIGRHRYFHRLYALDCRLPDLSEPLREELDGAMEGHILAEATLVGTYQRG